MNIFQNYHFLNRINKIKCVSYKDRDLVLRHITSIYFLKKSTEKATWKSGILLNIKQPAESMLCEKFIRTEQNPLRKNAFWSFQEMKKKINESSRE